MVSLPDIYEYGPNGVRDKATATEVVYILTDHGWVRPVEGGAQIVVGLAGLRAEIEFLPFS